MKAPIAALLLGAVLTMFVGCASPQRGAAYGHEQELRRQLAESVPMKNYGYTIKELRFTPDYRKANGVRHPNSQGGIEFLEARHSSRFRAAVS